MNRKALRLAILTEVVLFVTLVLSTGYGCELEIDKEMKSIVTGNFNDWAVFDPSWKKPTGLFTSVSWLAF
jgi:hypothetical protein